MIMTQRFVLLPARASPDRGLQRRKQNWTSQYWASCGGWGLESGISQRAKLQVRVDTEVKGAQCPLLSVISSGQRTFSGRLLSRRSEWLLVSVEVLGSDPDTADSFSGYRRIGIISWQAERLSVFAWSTLICKGSLLRPGTFIHFANISHFTESRNTSA